MTNLRSTAPVAMVALLNVHPSRSADLRAPDELNVDPPVPAETFIDSFGNRCTRFVAQSGALRLSGETLIHDAGLLRSHKPTGPRNSPSGNCHTTPCRYLYNSHATARSDRFFHDRFGTLWLRSSRMVAEVRAVCDWVHTKVSFGYQYARPTKSALDVFTERFGVCRDFQHLAVTLCRALNIPARYATGYLGDIGVPESPDPMDFSAWFEAYLEDRWWTFDARHNHPRIGRVLMATGRDASDVAITTSFGIANLKQFSVVTTQHSP